MSLVELMIASFVLVLGIGATLTVLSSGRDLSLRAQHATQASAVAQRELERLRSLPYASIGLSTAPAASASTGIPAGSASTHPSNPNWWVRGSKLLIRTTYKDLSAVGVPLGVPATGESFVVVSGGAAPGPESFSAGTATGRIYRYVTWHDDTCAAVVCVGTQDSKRITIAVVVNGGRDPKPVWVSTLVAP